MYDTIHEMMEKTKKRNARRREVLKRDLMAFTRSTESIEPILNLFPSATSSKYILKTVLVYLSCALFMKAATMVKDIRTTEITQAICNTHIVHPLCPPLSNMKYEMSIPRPRTKYSTKAGMYSTPGPS